MFKNFLNWIGKLYNASPYSMEGFVFIFLCIIVIYAFSLNPCYFFALLIGWTLNDFWKLCDNVNALLKRDNNVEIKITEKELLKD